MPDQPQPRNLDISKPGDAVELIAIMIGKLRMDGLTGGEVDALLTSLRTLREAHAAKAEG